MKVRKTLGNRVMVKLDPENNVIKTKSGLVLNIDVSFEPEKHMVLLGEVTALPTQLTYHKSGKFMPWKTHVEIKLGDRVIMYYLAVQNCLSKERKWHVREGEETWIFITYNNIYAVIRDGKIIPINGYILVEHIEDPVWENKKKYYEEKGIDIPDLRELSKTHCTYGKVVYIGKMNELYSNKSMMDSHIVVKAGDNIIMKKVRDIPLEYEYHTKLHGGRKLFRMQRHDILAIV